MSENVLTAKAVVRGLLHDLENDVVTNGGDGPWNEQEALERRLSELGSGHHEKWKNHFALLDRLLRPSQEPNRHPLNGDNGMGYMAELADRLLRLRNAGILDLSEPVVEEEDAKPKGWQDPFEKPGDAQTSSGPPMDDDLDLDDEEKEELLEYAVGR